LLKENKEKAAGPSWKGEGEKGTRRGGFGRGLCLPKGEGEREPQHTYERDLSLYVDEKEKKMREQMSRGKPGEGKKKRKKEICRHGAWERGNQLSLGGDANSVAQEKRRR